MAEVIRIDPERLKARHVARIVEVLRGGGVVIYPTDTVYGFGCEFAQKGAIERIRRLKGRDAKKPMSFVCADLTNISRYSRVSNFSYRLLKRFLPGPYTFVLPATKETPRLVQSKRKTVGIRIPDHPLPLALVSALGSPIISTSANRSDEEAITDPELLDSEFGHAVDLIVDCGLLPLQPSTVISLLNDEVEILREGAGDLDYFRAQSQE